MYRLWLWPLFFGGIGLASWVMMEYDLPKWMFSLFIIPLGLVFKLDQSMSGISNSVYSLFPFAARMTLPAPQSRAQDAHAVSHVNLLFICIG